MNALGRSIFSTEHSGKDYGQPGLFRIRPTPALAHPCRRGKIIAVVTGNLSDAALLLVGHGSTRNAAAAAPVYQHAAELRRRQCFAEVRECFWKTDPQVASVLGETKAARVFVVPFFISEGYFAGQIIPRALGFAEPVQRGIPLVEKRGNQMFYYCVPVGTHPGMTSVLLARAREVVERHPFPRAPKPAEISLFIAGHGTLQNENSRQAIERQVEQIRGLGLYAEVGPAFLEEEPRIADCTRLARSRNIVVVPFFISEGMHTTEDIPVLLGESTARVQERLQHGQPGWRNPTERAGKRLWCSESVGSAPLMAELILERVQEAQRR